MGLLDGPWGEKVVLIFNNMLDLNNLQTVDSSS